MVIFYENSQSLRSGILTVLTNRLGDSLFLCSIYYFLSIGGYTTNYINTINTIFVFIIVAGRITKRAQIPFCSWLPAAIAAPTPVSSLVHSSTLVTAGVYLMTRYNYLFFGHTWIFIVFGLLTMIISGFSAFLETDLKKLVAISTLRQLGIITFSLAAGLWKLTLFHIMLHSFFKSIMFLSAGRLILSILGNQDFRHSPIMLNRKLPIILIVIRILCLSGFPFTLGFYSKDHILCRLNRTLSILTALMFLLGCVATVSYRYRYLSLVVSLSLIKNALLKEENRYLYYVSSLLLFFICLQLGPMMNQLIPNPIIIIRIMDLFIGVIVIFASFLFIKFFPSGKARHSVNSGLLFMDWLRKGGISRLMGSFKNFKSERTWLELSGELQSLTDKLKKSIFSIELNSLKVIIMALPSIVLFLT